MQRRTFLKLAALAAAAAAVSAALATPAAGDDPGPFKVYLPAVAVSPAWRLGVAGDGELGETTILGAEL